MHLMPSFSPARVRDANRRGGAQCRPQHVDDAGIDVLDAGLDVLRGVQTTAGSPIMSERIGTLSPMGARAYPRRHLGTTDLTLGTVPADRSGAEAALEADGKALWASLRDDESMVLPTGPDEDLPG